MIKTKYEELLDISNFYDFYTLSVESIKVKKLISYSYLSRVIMPHFNSKRIIEFSLRKVNIIGSIHNSSIRRTV